MSPDPDLRADRDLCDIFPKTTSSQFQLFTLPHPKSAPEEPIFHFISCYHLAKNKIYFCKKNPPDLKHFTYVLNLASKHYTDLKSLRWDRIFNRLQERVLKCAEKRNSADYRTGFLIGDSTFVVKREFSFGFREVKAGTVHVYQLGPSPLMLYYNSGKLKFQERKFYASPDGLIRGKLKAGKNYVISAGVQYILVSPTKTVFHVQILPDTTLFEESFITPVFPVLPPAAPAETLSSPYDLPPATPMIHEDRPPPSASPPRSPRYFCMAPVDATLMPPPPQDPRPVTQPEPKPVCKAKHKRVSKDPSKAVAPSKAPSKAAAPSKAPSKAAAVAPSKAEPSPETIAVLPTELYPTAASFETSRAPQNFAEWYQNLRHPRYDDPFKQKDPTQKKKKKKDSAEKHCVHTAKYWRKMHPKRRMPPCTEQPEDLSIAPSEPMDSTEETGPPLEPPTQDTPTQWPTTEPPQDTPWPPIQEACTPETTGWLPTQDALAHWPPITPCTPETTGWLPTQDAPVADMPSTPETTGWPASEPPASPPMDFSFLDTTPMEGQEYNSLVNDLCLTHFSKQNVNDSDK